MVSVPFYDDDDAADDDDDEYIDYDDNNMMNVKMDVMLIVGKYTGRGKRFERTNKKIVLNSCFFR